MALGPKLNFINPGDALLASRVMQNFQALANFLRAIPVNNLLQPYQTTSFDLGSSQVIAASGPGTSFYFGYMRVQLGQAPTYITTSVCAWMRESIGTLAAGDSVTIDIQKATPSGSGGRVVFADAWTSILTAPITYLPANTVNGVDDVVDNSGGSTYLQTATPDNAVPIADGDWIRAHMVVTSAGAFNVTQVAAQVQLKSYLRS